MASIAIQVGDGDPVDVTEHVRSLHPVISLEIGESFLINDLTNKTVFRMFYVGAGETHVEGIEETHDA